jgi:hypothetical protein
LGSTNVVFIIASYDTEWRCDYCAKRFVALLVTAG